MWVITFGTYQNKWVISHNVGHIRLFWALYEDHIMLVSSGYVYYVGHIIDLIQQEQKLLQKIRISQIRLLENYDEILRLIRTLK